MQGGWINKDAYMQLPYFDDAVCKRIKQLLNGKTLFQYCMMKKEERMAISRNLFTEDFDHKFA